MKIPCRDNQVLFRENSWVIGYSIDLVPEHIGHIIDGVLGSTKHLRYTAEGIGILHMGFAAVNQFASLQQPPDPACCHQLPLVGPDPLNQLMERLNPSVEGLQ